MSTPSNKDVGAYQNPQKLHLFVADSGNSGVEQDGGSVDSQPVYATEGNAQALRSAEIVIDVDAAGSITGSETATLDVTLQDSADNAAWADVASDVLMGTEHGADAVPGAAALVLTGGGAEDGQVRFGVELARLRRYVRVQLTVTLSNAADSARVACYALAGGAAIRPADADKL